MYVAFGTLLGLHLIQGLTASKYQVQNFDQTSDSNSFCQCMYL